ncbi:MAG: histidine kinase, partial [Bacteroidota bacterium]
LLKSAYLHLPIPLGRLFLMGFLLSLLITLQSYLAYHMMESNYEFSWSSLFIRNFLSFTMLILFTPVMAYTMDVFLKNQARLRKALFGHLILSLGVSILHRILALFLQTLVYIWYTSESWNPYSLSHYVGPFAAGIISSFILYWLGVALFAAAENQKRLIKKERELANARMHALMTQLRPHFLFNTLNSISALIDLDREGAQKVIAQFADLLRGVLDKEEKQFVSLAEEIKFIRNYLDIEQQRYRENLQVEFKIAQDSLSARVPSLILQPLVENAIKHGISRMLADGCIRICSKILPSENGAPPRLYISIRDNGPGLSESYAQGIGLQNVNNRLQELYPEAFEFTIENRPEGGCYVHLIIPFKPAP